ncbi:MAG: hypothetical protein ACK5XT_17955 [Gemmatimonas sp.]|uniref:hypothetical protein n=1 Tax=Gemmatimonas sp. TaxID=1962908 RepID=UPI00391F8333|nr:hypothetical protein [Gemmatimonadota bacterium]
MSGLCLSPTLASAQSADAVRIREVRACSNAATAQPGTAEVAREELRDGRVVSSISARTAGADGNARPMAETVARRPDPKRVRTPKRIAVCEAWGVASERGDWVGTRTEPDGEVRLAGTHQAP